MRIFAFIVFLLLGFSLPGGNLHAQASSQLRLPAVAGIQKLQQAENAEPTGNHPLFVNKGATDETPSLIDVDDEDEELSTRKQVLLSRLILVFSRVFLSDDRDDGRADLLPFFDSASVSSSPKYIAQRTLRI